MSVYAHTADVMTTPNVILTASGSSEGVTKPSRTPDPASRIAQPTATVTELRAATPTAWKRVDGPGTRSAQKTLNPAATEMKMAVSSGRPCGRMKRKKCQGPA